MKKNKNIVIQYNENVFVSNGKLVSNFFTKFRGLMLKNKKDFNIGDGLLFTDCSSIHMFFMRFPIDVIFMDKHFKITKIVKGLKINHFSIAPKSTFYTLELPNGCIDTIKDIKVNDYINITF